MAGELIGALRVALGLDTAQFEAGSRKARAEAKSTAASIQSSLSGIKGRLDAVIGGAIAQQILQTAKAALDYASSLDEVSQQLGVTSKDLQVYRYAASQVGIDQETMDKGLQKLTKTMGEAAAGVKAPVEAFKGLGVSIRDSSGNLLTAGEVIPRLADALSTIKDPAIRARVETQLFGKAGQQLDTLLAGGSGAVNELAKAASDLGIVLSSEQIQNADAAADKLAEVKLVLEAKIAGVVADNAGAIFKLAGAFEHLIGYVDTAVDALGKFYTYGKLGAAVLTGDFAGARSQLGQARSKAVTDDLAARFPLSGVLPAKPVKGSGGFETAADPGGAKKAAAEAERQRKQALAQEDRFQTGKAQADSEFLGLRQQLAVDVREQAKYQHEQIDREAEAKARDLDLQVQEKQITAAAAEELKARLARNTDLQHAVVNRELDAKLDKDDLDAKVTAIGNQRDLLEAQADLATTASERRTLELRILDLQYEEERARLEAVVASKQSTETEKKIAQARLDALGELQGTARQGVIQATRGPGEAYIAGIYKTAGEKAEDFERSAVDGLKSVEDQLVSTTMGVLKLGGVFGNVANQIIGDLLRIAIQKNVTGPLAKALFGGASLPGGFDASGFSQSTIDAGAFDFSGLTGLAKGGRIGGFGGIDRNVLAINGSPVARVGRGEMLRIEPENDNGGRIAHIVPSPYFDVVVGGVADQRIGSAAPAIVSGSSSGTQRAIARQGRRRLA